MLHLDIIFTQIYYQNLRSIEKSDFKSKNVIPSIISIGVYIMTYLLTKHLWHRFQFLEWFLFYLEVSISVKIDY